MIAIPFRARARRAALLRSARLATSSLPLIVLATLLAPPALALPWESIGPDGGRVDGFCQSPGDADRLWLLPHRLGVWRSDDRGDSWVRVDTDLPMDLALQGIAESPADPDLLLVGDPEGRAVRRSTDGGVTWALHPVSSGMRSAVRIAFDPYGPKTALLAGGAAGEPGLYRSTDGGISWSVVAGLAAGAYSDFAFDPNAAGIALLAGNDGIRRSTDHGATWSLADTGGLTWGRGVGFSAQNPGTAWAVTGQEVLRSDDAGLSFVAVPGPGALCPSYECSLNLVAPHPVDPDFLLIGRHAFYGIGDVTGALDVLRTTDGGLSWTLADPTSAAPIENESAATIAWDREDPDRVFLAIASPYRAAGRMGFSVSTDAGISWAVRMAGIPGQRIVGSGHDAAGTLWIRGNARGALYRAASTDGPWTRLDTPGWDSTYDPTNFEVEESATDVLHESGETHTFDSGAPELQRSTDGGASWSWMYYWQLDLWEQLTAIRAAPAPSAIVYAAIEGEQQFVGRVLRYDYSDLPYPADLTASFVPADLLVHPLDPMMVFAAVGGTSGGVMRSSDGGETWGNRSTGLPAARPVALLGDPADGDRMRLVTETAGIWATDDGGLTWTAAPSPPAGTEVVAADWDPVSGRVFAATESDGAWIQDEGFATEGLPTRDLTSVHWLPAEGVVLLGTDHAGVWRRATPPVDAGPITVAAPTRLGLRAMPTPFTGATRLELALPPGRSAVDLSIHAVDGRRVARLLSGPVEGGTRTVTWDGRDASGRAVAAGVYFARLAREGETVTRRIVRLAE